MLDGLPILIVEDDEMIAIDLAFAVEEIGGRPVGPVATVAGALALLETQTVAAAVLDANLLDRDVTPLALALVERAVPFVVHTGTGLPVDLARSHPGLPVILKPAMSSVVLDTLLRQLSMGARPVL